MGSEKMAQIAEKKRGNEIEKYMSGLRTQEVQYCELEYVNNAIRPRIWFWVEWRYFQLLTRNI